MAANQQKRQSAPAGDAAAKRLKHNVGGVHKPSLGAPQERPQSATFITKGDVVVVSDVVDVEDPVAETRALTKLLDTSRGVLLSSSYEYPGRYAQWTVGFADPPVSVEAWTRRFRVKALNRRGGLFLPAIEAALRESTAVAEVNVRDDSIEGAVKQAEGFFSEEERSKQPTVFSLVRSLVELFSAEEDSHLGLYGAFGYDLTFQFDDYKMHQKRDPEARDLVLYIPDEILVVNHVAQHAFRVKYDFIFQGAGGMTNTKGLPRTGTEAPFLPRTELPAGVSAREFAPGEFAKLVDKAKEKFARGDLFEAVLSQTFREPCNASPSEIFTRLQQRNPAPYGFLINLGETEYLVGASPEMFVRVEKNPKGLRCETCPISGTIRRGRNALEDAENIRTILTDPKEESEITMCTDVDRNDKSRICQHGTVQVIGRRQIEMYSRLIHTVDHVEGYLRPEFDAIDAFLVHTWAVTVSGAPKTWAIQFVEESERSQRRWYGASVGHVAFDGHLNTGLTLRTVRISNGVAEVRAGATLLYDSVPEAEEKETELKASACLNAVKCADPPAPVGQTAPLNPSGGEGKVVLLIDFEDSFVNTLANYCRQTGARVVTVRHSKAEEAMKSMPDIDLALLSPGPGRPSDFNVSAHIQRLVDRKIPIFGVCLGLQSLVEHFGGKLGQLSYPMHGKPSKATVKVNGSKDSCMFRNISETFSVARYHSLYAKRPLPECLEETAFISVQPKTADESKECKDDLPIIMGIRHKTLPISAVQFHPESILTLPDDGIQMLMNALQQQAAK